VYYQKSLAHFAREYMEEGKVPMMTVRNIVPEGNQSKELRIRALEPLASNCAIHCKEEHTEFINEFVEYVPNSRICKKDLLDATAYQLQVARPGEPVPIAGKRIPDIITMGTVDEFIDECWKRANPVDAFGHKILANPYDPYNDTDTKIDFNPFT
jgi:hypothetical protein